MSYCFRFSILPLLYSTLLSVQTISCPALSIGASESLEADTPKTGTNEAPVSLRIPRLDSAPPMPAGPQSIIPTGSLTSSELTAPERAGDGVLNGNSQVAQPVQQVSSPSALIYRRPVEEVPALNVSAATGSVKLGSPPPTANVTLKPFRRVQVMEIRRDLPDIHFWTSVKGKPQLDCRIWSNGIGVLSSNSAYYSANMYSGAVNNGTWRGFSAVATPTAWICAGNIINLGPSLSPKIIALERQAIDYDDARAAAGESPIANIELSGSGIFWGPESSRTSLASLDPLGRLWERMVTRDPIKHRSYLKGPVRLTADYIRFDGPVSRIGCDVTLNARRIVVDGVELPPDNWRAALSAIVQPAGTETDRHSAP
jgi:hypothetical protein